MAKPLAPGTSPPAKALPQHLAALAEANRIRLARCRIVAELATLPPLEGWEQVARLLEEPPAELETCPVGKLICGLPRVGPNRARRLLLQSDLGWPANPDRPLGRLTLRQRRLLAGTVRAEAPRPALANAVAA